MEWIPNQPVYFGQPDECSLDEQAIVQLVDNSDLSQVQFTCEPCQDAVQILSDPDFTTASANVTACDDLKDPAWIESAGHHVGQLGVFADFDTTYCLNVVTSSTYTYVNPIEIYFGTNHVATITSGGSHIVTGQAVGNLDLDIFVTLGSSSLDEVVFSCCPCSTDAWDLGLGWTTQPNAACFSGSTISSLLSVYQFDETKYYQINITVSSISSGGLFRVELGSFILGYIDVVGTSTFYGTPIALVGSTSLVITPEYNTSEICISEITAYELLTNAIIAVYTKDGDYIASISQTEAPEQFILVKNTMTVTIDWADMQAVSGCYYLCFLDPCANTGGQNYAPNIINGDFSTLDVDGVPVGWSLANDWAYLPPMTGNYSDGSLLTQENVFSNTTSSFCISVDVVILASGGGTSTLDVYFGSDIVSQITISGTYTITGVPVNTTSLSFGLEPGSSAQILDVVACEITPDDYQCDLQSNMFQLGDYTNSCTLLINGCNNEDGLGFVFTDSGFSPRVRLDALLKQAKYPSERTIYEDSAGKKSNVYYSRRKAKQLCVDLQPEYIHDFLSLVIGFDNFYINGILYFSEDDEYSVEYPEVNNSNGKVRILVSEKTQNVKNFNCSDVENVCTLSGNYLLRADDLSGFVTQASGDKIIIGG